MAKGEARPSGPRTVPPPAPSQRGARARAVLVGRESEIDAVSALIATDAPLVTLWGPPGVGKTRLATEIQAQRDGASIFCDLTNATSSAEVAAIVGAAIDAKGAAGDEKSVVARVGHALSKRGRVLVILDNFEQLGEKGALAVARWLDMARDAQFLVTSRDPLAISAETLYEVLPLDVPAVEVSDLVAIEQCAAVRLFVARATAARPDYKLTAEEAQTTAAIVRALDGIPLAIELAAAQVALLGTGGIMSRLERRLEFLTDNRRDITLRQRTLRAAIGWSWDLLNESERRALANVSVFRGGFDADAAEAVIDVNEPTLLVLRSLRARSLVSTEPGSETDPRYRLLESVRVFALEELERMGERAATERRHANHFLSRVPKLGAPAAANVEEIRRLTRDIENFYAVFDHALRDDEKDVPAALRITLALLPLLLTRGPLDRLESMLEQVLAEPVADDLAAPVAAQALFARGAVRRRLGKVDTALADYESALAKAEKSARPELVARVLCDTGSVLLVRGEREAGRERLRRALGLAMQEGAHALVAEIESYVARGLWYEGNLEQARTRYAKALASAQRGKDVSREARILVDLAGVCRDLGREADLVAYGAKAKVICDQIEDVRTSAVLFMHLGIAAAEKNKFDEARSYFQESLIGFRRVGDRLYEANLESSLGYLTQAAGAITDGAPYFERALDILQNANIGWREALVRGSLGVTLATRDQVGAAEVEFDRATEALGGFDDTHVIASVDLLRGHVDLAKARAAVRDGDSDAALKLELAAEQRLERARRILALDGLGVVRRRGRGDVAFGMMLLERALREYRGGQVAPAPRTDTSAQAQGEEQELPDNVLIFGEDGSWFRVPAGDIVDIERRKSLRLILMALADARTERPGQHLSLWDLLSAGWPGEKVIREAGASRVHVAVATLRRMGLRDLLLHSKEGYMLTPNVDIARGFTRKRTIERMA